MVGALPRQSAPDNGTDFTAPKTSRRGKLIEKNDAPYNANIGKILIDPRNSDVVYVAAHGPVFKGGGERGLYKTTDGGETWTKVLDGGEWAGVGDVVMDPRNPDVLIAAVWQRARRQWGYIAGGPESRIHRSTDGGETWTRSQRGLPNDVDLGRIGLAISAVNPDVVYAIVEAGNSRGGFYRSQDNGINWERRSSRSTIGLVYASITTFQVPSGSSSGVSSASKTAWASQ